ncbi:MAG TPA: sigma-70 family RNA polymerase sigma factor [Haliangiales bacterium]|nr:sigma-70 family RNA polymerase sigma factor [Haliangiales bacterium]
MAGGSSADVERLVDHLFRHEFGRILAILTRAFGPEHLDLAEDVAQEALMKALEVWPYRGVPENPTAWLAQVAKNRAINVLNHVRLIKRKSQNIADALGPDRDADQAAESIDASGAMDDVARLMFVACHPALSAESRVALTLKTVAGLSVEEIASALLAQPTAVAQRLVRAKKQIAELALSFEVPAPAELPTRLGSVLEVLYLLFNEGYAAHGGDNLVRGELCEEAIRLGTLISRIPECDQPRVHALLALMLLAAARLDARMAAGGELLLLQQQDRSLWNRERIVAGMAHLEKSMHGDALTAYHLEAGIAACHATASSYEDTDWAQIRELYDQLLVINPSPVVALNHAVAVFQCDGPAAALRMLEAVREHPALQRYYLLWAILGKLSAAAGDDARAAAYYREALRCPCSAPERRFLESTLAALPGSSS